jgi:hypothetical protein
MEPLNSTSLPAADKPAKFARRTLSSEEWTAERIQRFGPDANDAKFVCPICRHVQSVRECRAAGMPDDCIGFSCIGRSDPRAFDQLVGVTWPPKRLAS